MAKTLSVYLDNGAVSVSKGTFHIGWRSDGGVIVVMVDKVDHGRFSEKHVIGLCINDTVLLQNKTKFKAE